MANMSFNAIYENKILAKISEFTISSTIGHYYALRHLAALGHHQTHGHYIDLD